MKNSTENKDATTKDSKDCLKKHPLVKEEIPIIFNKENSIEFLKAFILIDEEKKHLLKSNIKK